MNTIICLLVTIGLMIPPAVAISKAKLEAALPNVTRLWFAYRNIAGPLEGDKLAAWYDFAAERSKLGNTQLFYGYVLVSEFGTPSAKLNQIYSNVPMRILKHCYMGVGIAHEKQLHLISLPGTVDTEKINDFARSKFNDVFPGEDSTYLAIAHQAFQGPALSDDDPPKVIEGQPLQDYVFVMMALATTK